MTAGTRYGATGCVFAETVNAGQTVFLDEVIDCGVDLRQGQEMRVRAAPEFDFAGRAGGACGCCATEMRKLAAVRFFGSGPRSYNVARTNFLG